MGKEKEITIVIDYFLDKFFGYFSKEIVEKQYKEQYAVSIGIALHNAKQSDVFYTSLLRIISPHLHKTTNVIDVGCGLGRMTFECAKKRVLTCIGFDPNIRLIYEAIQIRNGRRKNIISYNPSSQCDFRVGDGASIYLTDRSVDIVLLINVLDRVKDPKLLVKESFRILRKGGLILIANPSDWNDAITPKSNQCTDIQLIFEKNTYKILKQMEIPFAVPLNARKSIQYLEEVYLIKKII